MRGRLHHLAWLVPWPIGRCLIWLPSPAVQRHYYALTPCPRVSRSLCHASGYLKQPTHLNLLFFNLRIVDSPF